ncbi:conserved hypothetical protein [Gammaproteobacteria bacterium]
MVMSYRNRFGHWLTLFGLFMGMAVWSNVQAMVEAQVDRNPVGMDESFTLTLEVEGSADDEPNLTELATDFDIRGRSQSTSLQIINGRSSRKVQWHFTLIPKRAGQLRIPAISVGSEQSRPIDLTVTADRPALATQQGGDLFIEVSVEPRTVYVQQQVVYTVRLFRTVELGPGSSLSDPKANDGDLVVERLGDGSEYQTSRDGRRYAVVERRYALYPQKSGPLTISPVLFDGSVIERSRSNRNNFFMLDPFDQNARPRRVHSPSLDLTVKSVPLDATKGQWLPARNLQLAQHWSLEPPKFVVGEPVTRTLALITDGLTAAQLPVINGAGPDGVKQYPDQPTLTDNRDSNGVTGTRQEKVALIPTQPGRFTLPPIEIPWWNTATDRPEVARLPASTIEVVLGVQQVAPSPVVPAPAAIPTPTPLPATESHPADPILAASISATPVPTVGIWQWLAFALALGWAVTALAWWRQHHGHPPSPNTSSPLVANRRQAERRLEQSCHTSDRQTAKTALLAWGQFQWPQHPPTSLTALAARVNVPLGLAIGELDRALYARATEDWNGESLWRAFKGRAAKGAAEVPVEEKAGEEALVALRVFGVTP